jgi:hypothetical protein
MAKETQKVLQITWVDGGLNEYDEPVKKVMNFRIHEMPVGMAKMVLKENHRKTYPYYTKVEDASKYGIETGKKKATKAKAEPEPVEEKEEDLDVSVPAPEPTDEPVKPKRTTRTATRRSAK